MLNYAISVTEPCSWNTFTLKYGLKKNDRNERNARVNTKNMHIKMYKTVIKLFKYCHGFKKYQENIALRHWDLH